MSSARNTIGNIGTSVLIYPITFFTSLVIARYLGPEDRGIYTYVGVLLSFSIPIFSLGLGGGILYFISKGYYKVSDVVYTLFLCALILGIFCAGLFYFSWHFKILGRATLGISWVETIYIVLSILFTSFSFFGGRLLIGTSNFKVSNTLNIFRNLSTPILMLLFVYVLSMKLHGAFLSLMIVNIVFAVFIIIYFLKIHTITFIININFLRDTFVYGIKGWFGDLAVRANVRLDQFILGASLVPSSLGIYSIAVLLSELLWIVPDAVGPVLFNRITKIKNDKEKLYMTSRITRLLFWFSMLAGIILFFASYLIIIPYGYGSDYLDAINVLWLLIPASIAMIFTKTTTKILSGSGFIGKTSTIQIVSTSVGIVLCLILIGPFGIMGAAISTLLSYITGAIYSFYLLRKYYKLQFSSWVILEYNDLNWLITTLKTLK